MATLQPEIELLLTCVQTPFLAEHADVLCARLQDDLDWDEVGRLARLHAVLPLLYQRLKTVAPHAVPAAAWDELQRFFQLHLRRNLAMTAELLKLMRLFEGHELAAIPYKGPALAMAAYGDVSLRQFGDLDILVHRQDVLTVKGLLLNQGYQAQYALEPIQESQFLKTGCELGFQHPTKGIGVDLHWNIVQPYYRFSLPIEPLWEGLQPLSLKGQQIQSLAPEDLLLILCIHNGKHHWDRLGWICDVAHLLQQYPQLDWEPLIDKAIGIGAARMLWLGLYLATDLLGASLPDLVRQRMQADPAVPALAAHLYKDLLQAPPRYVNRIVRFPLSMKMRERWLDRVRYGYSLSLSVPMDYFTLLPLAPYRAGLYHCLRPAQLLGKYAERLLQR